ncbi:unnamed protein product [Penicillium olsonii]|nr:unnamed protein product [Penicillium olsonii]
MNTTAGSFVLLKDGGEVVGDSFVIKQLRNAGAIILAKANLMEWSGSAGVNASAWSPRGGQVSSPFVVGGFAAGGDPGGSSSGPGAGVAAGFAPLAFGSDTEASIVLPSSRGALYGLRPSTGMTSRTGVVPISSSQDTTGPLGKSTWDVAVSLGIMAGLDPDDSYTIPAEPFRHDDYTKFIDANGFKGLRIGVLRDPFFESETARQQLMISSFNESLAKMEFLGATVLKTSLPNKEKWNYTFVGGPERSSNGTIRIRECSRHVRRSLGNCTLLTCHPPEYDLKYDMAQYLTTRRLNSSLSSLEDVINSMVEWWSLESPKGQCCFPTFIASDQVTDRDTSVEYWLAKYTQERLYEDGPAAIFRDYNLDVIVLPTEFNSARLGAVGRLPVGTVPLGYDDIELPFGLAFVEQRHDEGTVIRAMSAYEANFPPRRVPTTLK